MVDLDQSQIGALRTLQELWPDHRLVIIGATALDYHIGLHHRVTRDLDLIVTLELDEFPGSLSELEDWKQTPGMEHRFTTPDGLRVDILPAGPKLIAAGHLDWPNDARMSLLGMELAFAHTERVQLGETLTAHIATAPTLVVLKMVAWLDRHERTRDLADLAHLMELYISEDDQRRFTRGMVELGLRFEDQSAYLLGVDAGSICNERHRSAVTEFMNLVPRAQLAAWGPTRWQLDEDVVDAALAAFERGFSRRRSLG